MIGKIYTSVFPYYDTKKRENSFKKRPVLIIGGPRNNDYTVLPVSTVSKKHNLDPDYDIEVDPRRYPNLNLDRLSYIRTHKQTTVHEASLTREIGDLKSEYEELYMEVLVKLEEFNNIIKDQALKSGGSPHAD